MTQTRALKIIIILLIVILLLLGSMFYYFFGNKNFLRNSGELVVTSLSTNQPPKIIDEDIPKPTDAEVKTNYVAKNNEGIEQSTYEYVTKNDLTLMRRTFQRFFTGKGYYVGQSVESGGRSYLTASKDDKVYSVDLLDMGSKTQVSITSINTMGGK